MAVHFLEEEAETTEAMVPAMVETDESGQGGAENNTAVEINKVNKNDHRED